MKNRILIITGILILVLGLVSATLALAQGISPGSDQAEAQREAEAAAEAEANPAAYQSRAADLMPRIVITAPLFIGVDDAAVFTYLIDPDSGQDYPLFDGFGIWGAAYDTANKRVFFTSGSTLYEWPTNGSPAALGTIKGDTSGAVLSIVGLAYHDGTLYGARPLNSAADPEGVYTIDPVTVEATLYTTYDAPLTSTDIGGLDIDPDTGQLYGLNDASALRGLITIDSDGTITVVTPYPAAQSDIDGLSIGNGRAYMVTDEPGDIYVFDLAGLTYETPIPSPWTTAETFAGAAWISDAESLQPGISLIKTVGTDPNACAEATEIDVLSGTQVTYCYEVVNTGSKPLSRHDLEDSALGDLLTDLEQILNPGESTSITETATITATTVNTATWTAYNPGPTDVVTATATATVTVLQPGISLEKTVGADPNACATTTEIEVLYGAEVTYCYEVTNTGGITLTTHMLEDSALGVLLNDFAYSLVPGASAFITETAEIIETTVNTATWTAFNPGPTDVVTATAEATVTVNVPQIAVAPEELDAVLAVDTQSPEVVLLSNDGTADLDWTAYVATEDCDAPEPLLWTSVAPIAGTTPPGESDELVVTFDATDLPVGTITGVLCLGSNDPEQLVVTVPLSLTVFQPEVFVYLPVIAGSTKK